VRDTRSLGRRFRWLWAAYAVSAYGTGLGFGAMPLIAIRVLHAGAGEVSLLTSVGLAVGAMLAVPLGHWVEFQRKRPVMIAADMTRFATQITVPIAYLLGWLTFIQLLLVTILVAVAKIAFQTASGAHLRSLVAPEQLLTANSRFESTTWSAMVIGPPLGGAAIGLVGSVATITADALSYLLSALGIRMIDGHESPAAKADGARPGFRDLSDGWRYILTHARLRPVFINVVVVNSTIMATEPLLAVLLLRNLHFQPWQYGLAFAAPCIGGFVGSRLARPLVARAGQTRVILIAGILRVGWPIGLAFVPAGTVGLLLVMGLELGLITSCGIFNPVIATYRLQEAAPDRVARTLAAWSISTNLCIAITTALWGLLSELIGIRAAIAAAGVLALPTPFLLLRFRRPSVTAQMPVSRREVLDGVGRPTDRTNAGLS
jgi:MFS family permease